MDFHDKVESLAREARSLLSDQPKAWLEEASLLSFAERPGTWSGLHEFGVGHLHGKGPGQIAYEMLFAYLDRLQRAGTDVSAEGWPANQSIGLLLLHMASGGNQQDSYREYGITLYNTDCLAGGVTRIHAQVGARDFRAFQPTESSDWTRGGQSVDSNFQEVESMAEAILHHPDIEPVVIAHCWAGSMYLLSSSNMRSNDDPLLVRLRGAVGQTSTKEVSRFKI